MKRTKSATRVVHSIGADSGWRAARAALRDLGIEWNEYASEEDFLRKCTTPRPGSWILVHAHWPTLRVLDFLDRLRPVERGLKCILDSRDGFIANLVRAVQAGAVEVMDAPHEAEALAGLTERLSDPGPSSTRTATIRSKRTTEERSTAGRAVGLKKERSAGPIVQKTVARAKSSTWIGLGQGQSPGFELSPSRADRLTASERRVLTLLAGGHSPKAIAARLHRKVKTIDAHCANMRRKLGAGSTEELRLMAVGKLSSKAVGRGRELGEDTRS